MKKLSLILLAVALLATQLSCISDPEPPEPPPEEDYITLTGGEPSYRFVFDTPRVTHDKEYIVTFSFTSCQSDFIGQRMGGKIMYKNDINDTNEKGKVLSGWAYCDPEVVTGTSGTFRWTFKAGAANRDNVAIENPATSPEGAAQYFELTVQDKNWDNLALWRDFWIVGGFEIRERAEPPAGTTFQKISDITLDYSDSAADQQKGIGNILGEELAKLRASTLTEYAVLRVKVAGVTLTATQVNDRNSFGSIGNRKEVDGVNPNAQIRIPDTAKAGDNSFTADDIPVYVVLDHILPGETYLFVNMWDSVNSGIELWDYK